MVASRRCYRAFVALRRGPPRISRVMCLCGPRCFRLRCILRVSSEPAAKHRTVGGRRTVVFPPESFAGHSRREARHDARQSRATHRRCETTPCVSSMAVGATLLFFSGFPLWRIQLAFVAFVGGGGQLRWGSRLSRWRTYAWGSAPSQRTQRPGHFSDKFAVPILGLPGLLLGQPAVLISGPPGSPQSGAAL